MKDPDFKVSHSPPLPQPEVMSKQIWAHQEKEDEDYFPDNRVRTRAPNVLLVDLEYEPMTLLSAESYHRLLLFLSMGLEQIEGVGDSGGYKKESGLS